MDQLQLLLVVFCAVVFSEVCGVNPDPCIKPLLPSEIRFTQENIKPEFSHQHLAGRDIGNVAMNIINQWPPTDNSDFYFIRNNLQVARGRGELSKFCFSASNRGLWLLKAVEDHMNRENGAQKVQRYLYKVFPSGDIEDKNNLKHDFTAIGGGSKIQIRGTQRFDVQNIDFTAGFWEYVNRCLNKLLPSEIDYSTRNIPLMYNGQLRLYGDSNIRTMADNIIMYWNQRFEKPEPRDIYNYNACEDHLTLTSIKNGRRWYCFASDNQCLWILKTVEERAKELRRPIDKVAFGVVDGRVTRQKVNIRGLLDDGKSVTIGGNQRQMERTRNQG